MNKKRILVILHLYYQDLWDEIKNYLLNLQNYTNFDLHITCVEKNEQLFNNILSSFSKNVNIKIEILENIKGADIYPFIHVINQINLDNYDFVYKLHTKQTFPVLNVKIKEAKLMFYIGHNLWRDFLFNAILGKEKIKKVFKIFEKKPKSGAIGFGPLFIETSIDKNDRFYKRSAKKCKFNDIQKSKCFAGTAFIIRGELLKCIQNIYSKEDFIEETNRKFVDLAYFIEGFLGYIVEAQGYKLVSSYPCYTKFILTLLSHKHLKKLYMFYVNRFILK